MLATLCLSLGILLLFLLLLIYYFSHSPRDHLPGSPSERLDAAKSSRMLLQEILSKKEYEQLIKFGYFEVSSPSFDNRIYRIPGSGGRVKVYERGVSVMELFLQPCETLPDEDKLVMNKLMIEADELEYLQKSDHYAPSIISLRLQQL